MHILSPETDNCPSWISGGERMTVENISWSISTKECCRPRRGLNPRPPGLQSDGASNWATEAGYCNRGTALERSVGKLLVGVGAGVGCGPELFKPVLLTRNLTLNADVAPSYFIFGPHRDSLPHLWNITAKHIYNQKHCDETKQRVQWRSESSPKKK